MTILTNRHQAIVGKLNKDGKTVTYSIILSNAHWVAGILEDNYSTDRKSTNLVKSGYINYFVQKLSDCDITNDAKGGFTITKEVFEDYKSLARLHKVDAVYYYKDGSWSEVYRA